MSDQEEAVRLVVALDAFGYAAWVEEYLPGRWSVWCEDAGLVFQDSDQVKRWLVRRWAATQPAQEVLHG